MLFSCSTYRRDLPKLGGPAERLVLLELGLGHANLKTCLVLAIKLFLGFIKKGGRSRPGKHKLKGVSKRPFLKERIP